MSNKVQTKPLLAKSSIISEHHLPANCAMTFNHYQQQLQANVKGIMLKYPLLNNQKVRDLLEELDNNSQLALQILQEEEKHCGKIVQEKRTEVKKPSGMTLAEENKILKQSFLNLYKKFLTATSKLDDLTQKYTTQHHQNLKLKQLNRLLFQKQYQNPLLEDHTPIF